MSDKFDQMSINEVRDSVRLARKMVINNSSVEEFLKLYKDKEFMNAVVGRQFDIQFIFRARLFENELFYEEKELKYPPKESVTKKGRFNDVNESVFYGCSDAIGAMLELKKFGKPVFYVTKYKKSYTGIIPWFLVGTNVKNADSNMFRQDDIMKEFDYKRKVIWRYMQKETSKEVLVGNEEEYNSTIAIAKDILYSGLLNSDKTVYKYKGLIYPSVISQKLVKYQSVFNIALLPDVFDDSYCIDETAVFIPIIKKDQSTEFFMINKGKLDNKKINWVYKTKEMIKRTNADIDFFGNKFN